MTNKKLDYHKRDFYFKLLDEEARNDILNCLKQLDLGITESHVVDIYKKLYDYEEVIINKKTLIFWNILSAYYNTEGINTFMKNKVVSRPHMTVKIDNSVFGSYSRHFIACFVLIFFFTTKIIDNLSIFGSIDFIPMFILDSFIYDNNYTIVRFITTFFESNSMDMDIEEIEDNSLNICDDELADYIDGDNIYCRFDKWKHFYDEYENGYSFHIVYYFLPFVKLFHDRHEAWIEEINRLSKGKYENFCYSLTAEDLYELFIINMRRDLHLCMYIKNLPEKLEFISNFIEIFDNLTAILFMDMMDRSIIITEENVNNILEILRHKKIFSNTKTLEQVINKTTEKTKGAKFVEYEYKFNEIKLVDLKTLIYILIQDKNQYNNFNNYKEFLNSKFIDDNNAHLYNAIEFKKDNINNVFDISMVCDYFALNYGTDFPILNEYEILITEEAYYILCHKDFITIINNCLTIEEFDNKITGEIPRSVYISHSFMQDVFKHNSLENVSGFYNPMVYSNLSDIMYDYYKINNLLDDLTKNRIYIIIRYLMHLQFPEIKLDENIHKPSEGIIFNCYLFILDVLEVLISLNDSNDIMNTLKGFLFSKKKKKISYENCNILLRAIEDKELKDKYLILYNSLKSYLNTQNQGKNFIELDFTSSKEISTISSQLLLFSFYNLLFRESYKGQPVLDKTILESILIELNIKSGISRKRKYINFDFSKKSYDYFIQNKSFYFKYPNSNELQNSIRIKEIEEKNSKNIFEYYCNITMKVITKLEYYTTYSSTKISPPNIKYDDYKNTAYFKSVNNVFYTCYQIFPLIDSGLDIAAGLCIQSLNINKINSKKFLDMLFKYHDTSKHEYESYPTPENSYSIFLKHQLHQNLNI